MAFADAGAPKGGRGIDSLASEPILRGEAIDLIDELDDISKLIRRKPMNSVYESKSLHLDATPIGGDYPYKIEIQRKKGNKNTVANCIAKATADVTDIQGALTGSLGNQHNWTAE